MNAFIKFHLKFHITLSKCKALLKDINIRVVFNCIFNGMMSVLLDSPAQKVVLVNAIQKLRGVKIGV